MRVVAANRSALLLRLSAARGRIGFFEFTHLNSLVRVFALFLELVSQAFPDDLFVIQLDNGGFHKAKKLQIPHNVILMFQPVRSLDLKSRACGRAHSAPPDLSRV